MRREIPPETLALARVLLVSEGEIQLTEQIAAATEQVVRKLYLELAQFIGPEGFRALFNRSLHVVARESPALRNVRLQMAEERCLVGLGENLASLDAADAVESVLLLLATFIELLGTFIGGDLAYRMIQRRWPELPYSQADPGAERA